MPWCERPNNDIYFTFSGNPGAPALLFSHSLGTDSRMWDYQVDDLQDDFFIIRYDHPGHGRSGAFRGIPAIGDLGNDAVAVLDKLGLPSAFFCGLSLGGMVGIWLGAHAADRFPRIAVCSSAATAGNAGLLLNRIAVIKEKGIHAISSNVIEHWFTEAFRAKNPGVVKLALEMLLGTDPDAYVALIETIRQMDLRPELTMNTSPFLTMYGDMDLATPPAVNRYLHDRIGNSTLVALRAAHLANIEARVRFSQSLRGFMMDPESWTTR